MDVAILHHRADVEVAGAKFVEGGDALDKLAATVGYGLGDAFTQKYVQTKLGGHEIIAVRIAAWLRIPKLMAEDGVQIRLQALWHGLRPLQHPDQPLLHPRRRRRGGARVYHAAHAAAQLHRYGRLRTAALAL